MRRLLLCLSTVLISSQAFAGPFGLEFGSSLASLSKLKLKQEKPFVYTASSLPNGHPDFDDYRLIVTPRFGLCKYSGWMSNVETNSYGDGLRAKYDALLEALTEKYGQPQTYDFLRTGSIWRERREFMMGLKLDERSLSSFWTRDKASLPEDIGSIQLKAYALSERKGMISVTYSGVNESDCLKSMAEQRNSTL